VKEACSFLVYAKQASQTLDAVIKDLKVSLKFAASAYSPEADEIISAAMSWRTNQVPKAALLIEKLSLPGLIAALRAKNVSKVLEVEVSPGVKAFSRPVADAIVNILSDPVTLPSLQQAGVFDLPKLTITRFVTRGGKEGPTDQRFLAFVVRSTAAQEQH